MSEKLKENLELYHSEGVFIPTKTFNLLGEVDDNMLEKALCNLHALDSVSGEITIKLVSDGGSVAVARAIYDLIRGCKNRVRIMGYGDISSAATLILQAGDYRSISDNAKLMIHVGEEGYASNHPRNIERLFEQSRADEYWMENVYLERIKEKKKRFTRQKLKDTLEFDKFLSPKQALELGLIDNIGEIDV